MGQITGFKVRAGNDANVAALGEMWQGGGKGYKNMVMVTLGTGVGGGIIINEHILAGINGAAGEIGHIPMRDDELETCGCGKKGCLEQYASATGIVRITKEYLEKNPEVKTTLRGMDGFTAKEIFDEAKKGDKAALTMVDEVGCMLGKALASIACTVNPEVFVIGGGMAKAGNILLDAIKKYYTQYAFHAAYAGCNNVDELFKAGLDAVSICTSNDSHAELATCALETDHQKERELVRSGAIGKILSFEMKFVHREPDMWTGNSSSWFYDIATEKMDCRQCERFLQHWKPEKVERK